MRWSRYVRLYIQFLLQYAKVMIEYRTDFLIGFISSIFIQSSSILTIWIIFENVNDLKGWSFNEIVFIYGLLLTSKSLNHIFFDNIWMLGPEYIKNGKLDIILLRPVPPLFHIISDKIQQDGIGSLIMGAIFTTISFGRLNTEPSIMSILLLIIIIISGSFIFSAVNLIVATISFWIVNSQNFIAAVFTMHEFAYFPLNIYPKFIAVILTFIIPYFFVSYYPATYFLERELSIFSYSSPLVALSLWLISILFWRFGVRNYTSTGS